MALSLQLLWPPLDLWGRPHGHPPYYMAHLMGNSLSKINPLILGKCFLSNIHLPSSASQSLACLKQKAGRGGFLGTSKMVSLALQYTNQYQFHQQRALNSETKTFEFRVGAGIIRIPFTERGQEQNIS